MRHSYLTEQEMQAIVDRHSDTSGTDWNAVRIELINNWGFAEYVAMQLAAGWQAESLTGGRAHAC